MNDHALPSSDSFDRFPFDAPWRTALSLNPLGSLRLEEEILRIRASAHSFAFVERPLPSKVSLIQCAISLGKHVMVINSRPTVPLAASATQGCVAEAPLTRPHHRDSQGSNGVAP